MRVWIGNGQGGQVMPVEDARISPLDHGFTVADGVFETLKVVDSQPFALTRHLRRFALSASVLGLHVPDRDAMVAAVSQLLSSVGDLPLGRLRITLTGGESPLGSDRGDALPTLVIVASPISPWPDTTSVRTVAWPRNERSALAGVKSTSYAENVHALAFAHRHGASEAIFANTRGELCEGTGSNVFVVVDGQVLTPPLDSGCLAGITRELVCEWTEVTEAALPMSILQAADEVFITSSTRDIHPVVVVDERHLAAGPITSGLRQEFARRSRAQIDP